MVRNQLHILIVMTWECSDMREFCNCGVELSENVAFGAD